MLKRIRVELAREPGSPEGNPSCGYELVLPLDRQGHIDIDAWQRDKLACTVHRFWKGEPDQAGQVVRTRGGAWAFSYERGEADDERLHRLGAHSLKEREYISIHGHDGHSHTFKVVSVRPAFPAAAEAR